MKLINLIPLKEIDFPSQGAFDTYSKAHKLRPDTKVKIAGKTTTAGRAAQNSAPVKGGTSVFGKDKGGDVFGGKTPSNYAFTPKDAEKKYKSAAISMLIPKLNPKDIPNIQKQLSKMDVDADFNVEKDGVRVWTRSGDYSNVGDVLKSKGLKRKQTMPTDADYQKWDDKLRASSGIKPTGGDKKSDTSLSSMIPTGDATKDDFYNAGETLRQMGWTPDDIAKRIGSNLPDIDDENDIPQIKDSDDKEDWINLYKKSIAMKKAGYSSSEIADKLRANL
jgi:hypothetical protein